MGNGKKAFDAIEEEWYKPWEVERRGVEKVKKASTHRMKLLAQTPLPTEYGSLTYLVFGDYATGAEHAMAIYGNYKKGFFKGKKDILLRIHSSCGTSELFHATNCKCREELDEAMKKIRREGEGIVIYLYQEGAGNGLVAKVRAYERALEWKNDKVVARKTKDGKPMSVYQACSELGYAKEHRAFEIAAEMLKIVGVKSVRLMTNNPEKVEGLRKKAIKVTPVGLHIKPTNKIMAEHLRVKAELLGHKISKKDWKLEK